VTEFDGAFPYTIGDGATSAPSKSVRRCAGCTIEVPPETLHKLPLLRAKSSFLSERLRCTSTVQHSASPNRGHQSTDYEVVRWPVRAGRERSTVGSSLRCFRSQLRGAKSSSGGPKAQPQSYCSLLTTSHSCPVQRVGRLVAALPRTLHGGRQQQSAEPRANSPAVTTGPLLVVATRSALRVTRHKDRALRYSPGPCAGPRVAVTRRRPRRTQEPPAVAAHVERGNRDASAAERAPRRERQRSRTDQWQSYG